MNRKKKICTGFDENPHEDYIYKNIDGKKYCKTCTYKLQPQKKIGTSDKAIKKYKFRLKIKQDKYQKDSLFYREVWFNRFYAKLSNGDEIMTLSPRCTNCSKRLGEEPKLTYFHHLLEKRNYEKYRYLDENIYILCEDCHSSYENLPNLFPKINKAREVLKNKLNI